MRLRLLLIYSLVFSLLKVFSGGMAFWFDPARDFLLALGNLQKPTLIGGPTGIPGIFYGPYWIWLISLGLLISLNPLVVTAIILTLPYVIIFPYLLFRLRSSFNGYTWIILWLLFFNSFYDYMISIWNPHLSPLLFLLLVFLILKAKRLKEMFLSGTVSGLIINFHFSFGLGILIGCYLYFLIRRAFKISGLFTIGVITAFIPSIVFEFRHGFNQLKSFINVFINSAFYNTAAVGQTGLSKTQIIEESLKRLTRLLQGPSLSGYDGLFLSILFFILFFKLYFSKVRFSKNDTNILLLSLCIGVGTLSLYLFTKNPVWGYHFIGFEIIYLLLLGLVINKIKVLKYLLILWVFILTTSTIISFALDNKVSPYSLSSIKTKSYIVDTIYKDAKYKNITFFAYSPSIYTYDYDYIFKWYQKSKYSYLPDHEIKEKASIYLIIPKTDPGIFEDFINYKTPQNLYKSSKTWNIEDGTIIIKREETDGLN